MTTIILTTIGILIATASVLFVVFYGGDAFFSGRIQSEASRLTVEGAQIEQSVESFRIREGRLPGNGFSSEAAMQDIINKKFIDGSPPGANGPWVIDFDNNLIRADVGALSDEYSKNVCKAARSQQKLPFPETIYMCNGSDHPSGYLPANEPCCRF